MAYISKSTKANNHGQALGRKGLETKQRLKNAAVTLLKVNSPVELTAVAVAKMAKSSSATFYLYFSDVHALLVELNKDAEKDMDAVYDVIDQPWGPNHPRKVIDAFVSVWEKHREVLRYRNLEADRGDPEFESIRLRTSIRIVSRFADHIYANYPPSAGLRRSDAVAEASVLVAAMERLAAIDLETVNRGIGPEAMWDGMVRIISRTLNPADVLVATQPKKSGGSKIKKAKVDEV